MKPFKGMKLFSSQILSKKKFDAVTMIVIQNKSEFKLPGWTRRCDQINVIGSSLFLICLSLVWIKISEDKNFEQNCRRANYFSKHEPTLRSFWRPPPWLQRHRGMEEGRRHPHTAHCTVSHNAPLSDLGHTMTSLTKQIYTHITFTFLT